MIDETIQKEIGVFIWSIILAFGFVLFELLRLWGLSPMVIFFTEFIWFASDALLAAFMWHYFKVRRGDVPTPPIGKPILTPIETPITAETIKIADSPDTEAIPE